MRRFDPRNIHKLTSADRAAWLNSDRVLSMLNLHKGLTALDFGAGPGYFTLPIAERIAPTGRVFAVDVEPEMHYALRQRAAEVGISNIVSLICDDKTVPFAAETIDRVLLSLVLHEVDDRSQLLAEVQRVLRPGGHLALVEWQPWETEHGPDLSQRLEPAQVAIELKTAKLRVDGHSPLSYECYLMTATKLNSYPAGY